MIRTGRKEEGVSLSEEDVSVVLNPIDRRLLGNVYGVSREPTKTYLGTNRKGNHPNYYRPLGLSYGPLFRLNGSPFFYFLPYKLKEVVFINNLWFNPFFLLW